MQDIVYTYDSVSNITGIANGAGMLPNGLGGTYSGSYKYNNLYRLTNAAGSWQGLYNLSYHTGMGYCANGRVNKKNIAARRLRNGISDTVNYLYGYFYENPVQRNTLTRVVCFGSTGDYDLHYSWTSAGNMDTCDTEGAGIRRLCWDEQNRLQGVIDENYLSYYLYDAAGDRTYKLTGKVELQNISGEWRDFFKLYNTTLYASPYVVATDKGYTKHYYAESERIASRIGGGRLHNLDQPIVENTIIDEKKEHINKLATDVLGNCLDARWYDVSTGISKLYIWRDSVQPEKECYWYHPDHLGSSSWITYSDGKAVQHLHYLPWGEDFVDQRLNSFDGVRHTFSAKEKDAETGYSYFGARYYSSDLSIWLSVDPMAAKYPSLSPYVYCADNPVKLVDPNGEEFFDDIVFHGINNSSITVKTSVFDLDINANVDFGGNYTLDLENVAIGFQTEFVATGQAGIGTSYSGFSSKIMFLGGDYSGYWYDYIGGEMQLLCGASVEASFGIQTSIVLGFYSGDKKGNTPESFAGAYTGVSCSAGIKATFCGANLNASNVKSVDNKWTIYTFGVSFTQGYQGGLGLTVGSGFGHAKLITKSKPTKDRTIGDRVKNLLSH